MSDVHDPETRSRNMRAIRHRDTKPELTVRSYLHRAGLRFSLHGKSLPGKPDLVLPKRSAVVFVHGCYWHRHPGCPYATTPKTRTKFWTEKLNANRERDLRNQEALEEQGWNVFTVWECETKSEKRLQQLAATLRAL